jgi:hypothetical protein
MFASDDPAAPADPAGRRYRDREVALILRRAAERQQGMEQGGLTLVELRRVADRTPPASRC